MKLSSFLAKLTAILSFFTVFVILPITVIYVTTDSLIERKIFKESNSFRLKTEPLLKNVEKFTDIRLFWGMSLQRTFYRSRDAGSFLNNLKKLKQINSCNLRTLVIDKNDRAIANTLTNKNLKDWLTLKKIYTGILRNRNASLSNFENYHLKKVLGPHFSLISAKDPLKPDNSKTISADFSGEFPDFWFNFKQEFSVIVEFPSNYRQIPTGIKFLARQMHLVQKEFSTAIIGSDNRIFKAQSAEIPEEILGSLKIQNLVRTGFSETNHFLVRAKQLNSEFTILFFKKKPAWLSAKTRFVMLGTVFYFLLLTILFRTSSGFNFFSAKIKTQIVLTVFLANALPGYILVSVASDHFHKKEARLIKDKHLEQIRFLQEIDEKVVLENTRLFKSCIRAKEKLKADLSSTRLDEKVVKNLSQNLGRNCNEFYIVASEAFLIGSNHGFYDGKKYFAISKKQTLKEFKPTSDAMRGVGYLFLFLWNRISVSDTRKIAETEIIIETLFQAKAADVFQSFIGFHDNFSVYNWGSDRKPVFLTTIDSFADGIVDYLLIAFFDPDKVAKSYLQRRISSLNKILPNSSIFIGRLVKSPKDQQPFGLSSDLYPLLLKTETHPSLQPVIVNRDSQQFVFSGLTCSSRLRDMRLFALFPVEIFRRQINHEINLLLGAGIFAVTLILSILAIFIHGFIAPVNALQEGAKAMEKQKFSYRLPKLGRDELGEIALIFNDSMNDLEELTVAGSMQNQIMPTEALSGKNFSLYGKSIVLSGLGGDYFDYFAIKDQEKPKFTVMMGDVAGHGVGAALLMAMAKTTVNFYSNLLNEPMKLISELHKLILATKTKKQRKIMTFQILSFDPESLACRYSNAGACSPIIVEKDGKSAREIALAGPALGAFKKCEFKEIELKLKRGDAFIFYTDGIVEAKNQHGELLGYNRLAEILKKSWHPNAEEYFQRVIHEYDLWLENSSPEDDLTIVILTIK